MDCDILIKNGKIYDGTGAEAYDGSLAIKGGRIDAAGNIQGETDSCEIIDARGLAIAPGFIDVHTHAGFILASPENSRLMEPFIRQGITTIGAGNCGLSPAPVSHDFVDQLATYWDCVLPEEGLQWNWTTMGDFLAHMDTHPPALNVAQLVGHGNVRLGVMGYQGRTASDSEIQAMRGQVRQALEEGAMGLSFGLGYVPGVWANTEELIEVARDLPDFGGCITVHMRNQGGFIEKAVNEMIHVAETVGVPLQISHYAPFALEYMEHFFRSYEATEAARERGVSIGYDLLPFAVASTTVLILYPPWMFNGGMDAFFERLEDPEIRKRLVEEFRQPVEWPSWETGKLPAFELDEEQGWSAHRIHGFRKPENQRYEGVNLEAIAEDMDRDPLEALFDLTLSEEGRIYYTSGFHDDEDTDLALGACLRLPHMSFMTDAVGIGRRAPHPSHYGSYPRFLGKHVRDWETYTLAEAIRKSTSLPASHLGITDRGVISEGARADIVIFDPQQIIEKGSFAKPYQYCEGIETVIINGAPVWKEGRFDAAASAGQVIRR